MRIASFRNPRSDLHLPIPRARNDAVLRFRDIQWHNAGVDVIRQHEGIPIVGEFGNDRDRVKGDGLLVLGRFTKSLRTVGIVGRRAGKYGTGSNVAVGKPIECPTGIISRQFVAIVILETIQ